MAKIVVTNLNPDKPKRAERLRQKRVRDEGGKQRTIYVLETERPDVGDQLRTVFQLNVNRARRRASPARIAAE